MSGPAETRRDASLTALVAALEAGEVHRLPVEAMAAPWDGLARLAQASPDTSPGALAWTSTLSVEALTRAGLDRPESLRRQFRGVLHRSPPPRLEDALSELASTNGADDDDVALIREGSAILAIADPLVAGKPRSDAPAPNIITAADVQPEQVRWWWRGRLALGKLTVLEGDPDVGKSTVLLDLAARVSTGREMPDGTPAPEGPGDVVILSAAEDGLADTVVPRLLAAGADMHRVHVWTGTPQPDGYLRGFELQHDLVALERFVVERGVRMIVNDALMSSMPAGQSSNLDPDTRRLLHPFVALTERTGAIAAVNRHFKKGSDRSTNRGGGSVAIGAVARCVLAALRDDDDEAGERRLLGVTKANLLAEPERASMAFRIVGATVYDRDRTPIETARVEWLGNDERRVPELLHRADDEEGSGRIAECARALRELLADGPAPANDIERDLKGEDFRPSTIRRARERLDITRDVGNVYRETQAGKGSTGAWIWRLPEPADNPSPDDHAGMVTWGQEAGTGSGEHVAETAPRNGSHGSDDPRVGARRLTDEHLGHLGHLAPEEAPDASDEQRWEDLAASPPEAVTDQARTVTE